MPLIFSGKVHLPRNNRAVFSASWRGGTFGASVTEMLFLTGNYPLMMVLL